MYAAMVSSIGARGGVAHPCYSPPQLEAKKLRREKGLLEKSTSNSDGLRKELFAAQRELLKERSRCKALEEELETPMNVHRWRKLEGSDPGTYVTPA